MPGAVTVLAFATITRLNAIPGSTTQFNVQYQGVLIGIGTPWEFSNPYTYDSTQTPAANLTALKNAIASLCGSAAGVIISVSNIFVNLNFQ
jgi:hypothetical protein